MVYFETNIQPEFKGYAALNETRVLKIVMGSRSTAVQQLQML